MCTIYIYDSGWLIQTPNKVSFASFEQIVSYFDFSKVWLNLWHAIQLSQVGYDYYM